MGKVAANRKCRAGSSQLAVIDIQERLGAAMPNKVLNRVLQNAVLLARTAGGLEIPVVQTEQYPEGLGATHSVVAAALPDATQRLRKTCFSCAGLPEFVETLHAHEARRQIVLVGMEAHICVLQTALDLVALDFEVFVVEDAICSRRLENYQNALERLRDAGVSIVSAESAVFEWLEDSKHPHFKAIQTLLR
jgi:isochorismate hydrolase